jgi:SAM-dependent methyltransferase
VLHLQCHIGRDTLCLARRGAIVTGLDFSPAAIKIARRLAEETGLNATFIEGRVDETSQLAPGPFDLVFATWGRSAGYPTCEIGQGSLTACWRPAANFIAQMRIRTSWCWRSTRATSFRHSIFRRHRTGRWIVDAEPTTYMGDPTSMTHRATRIWLHSLSAVFGALMDAGLTITMFHEHEVLPWRRYAAKASAWPGETIALSGDVESLVAGPDRMWRLRDGHPRLPLSFSLKARKEA